MPVRPPPAICVAPLSLCLQSTSTPDGAIFDERWHAMAQCQIWDLRLVLRPPPPQRDVQQWNLLAWEWLMWPDDPCTVNHFVKLTRWRPLTRLNAPHSWVMMWNSGLCCLKNGKHPFAADIKQWIMMSCSKVCIFLTLKLFFQAIFRNHWLVMGGNSTFATDTAPPAGLAQDYTTLVACLAPSCKIPPLARLLSSSSPSSSPFGASSIKNTWDLAN